MGCWNVACSATGIMIFPGDDVAVFVVDPLTIDEFYTSPFMPPILCKYGDYGGVDVSECDEKNLKLYMILSALLRNEPVQKFEVNDVHKVGDLQDLRDLRLSTTRQEKKIEPVFAWVHRDAYERMLSAKTAWQIYLESPERKKNDWEIEQKNQQEESWAAHFEPEIVGENESPDEMARRFIKKHTSAEISMDLYDYSGGNKWSPLYRKRLMEFIVANFTKEEAWKIREDYHQFIGVFETALRDWNFNTSQEHDQDIQNLLVEVASDRLKAIAAEYGDEE